MLLYSNFNGETIPESLVHISPGNQSFKYGDGCFETMKMIDENILLQNYHLERLYQSLVNLKLNISTNLNSHNLINQIIELAQKNNHESFARIRLTIYRKGENYNDIGKECGYIIQTMRGDENTNQYNENGLVMGIYTGALKSCDNFSTIKSNNYLPYIMAKIWALENNFDDALVCNTYGRVAESAIANIFIVEDGIIKTPPITEGCIGGVMRRHFLKCLNTERLPHREEALNIEQVLNAAEVFLTNAINGIRWIKKIDNSEYSNDLSSVLYKKYINPLLKRKTI